MIGKGVFSAVRRLGNTALCNGIGVSNMSLGAVVRFTALLLGWRKYVGDKEYALPSGLSYLRTSLRVRDQRRTRLLAGFLAGLRDPVHDRAVDKVSMELRMW